MLRWTPVVFLGGAALSYFLCALIGLAATPRTGATLQPDLAVDALTFSFPAARGWENVAGSASHGWLYRRAHLEGEANATSAGAAKAKFSEQLLKVGWPFTSVRGFVRFADGQPDHRGVGWTDADGTMTAARMLPLQPVWPGLVLNGSVAALLWVFIAWWWKSWGG